MKYISTLTAKAVCCAAIAIGLSLPGRVQAATSAFVYQFTDVFQGSAPEGTPPWISTAFSDISPGVVQMTITAEGMTTAESLSSLLLNLNPTDNPKNLSFSYVSSTGSFTHPTVTTGENQFKADGDGKYDIDLSFSDKTSKIFSTGDSITIDITSSTPGLDALDFDALSKPSAGGAGPFLAAAEFQCTTTPSITEWVAPVALTPVPEPGTIGIFAAGATLLAAAKWRKSRSARAS